MASSSESKDKCLLKILGDKVVMSGDLYTKKRKFIRKKWGRCYGILTKEYFTICDNKNSKESRKMYPISKFEGSLDDKVVDEEHCFVITFEERHRKPLLFACDRKITRDTWIEHVRDMIDKCKKFSADSAYASGGSISSRQGERTSMYSAIDELKITSPEDVRRELALSSTVSSNWTNLTDSGFINVQKNTQETKLKATTFSGAINPKMDTLKLPIPESGGVYSVDNSQDIYENTDIIKEVTGEDVNTLRKNKATLSNKQADSGFIKFQQNTNETRLKATYGSKATDPRMNTSKLPLSECIGARSDSRSDDGDQDNYENDAIIKEVFGADVNTLRRNKGMKTAAEKIKKCNLSTESDEEIVDSHKTEEVVLRSTSNSPSRSETSRSSGDSDQIYENVTMADYSKRFKAEEYMCHDRNNKLELKQMPEGTFCVRPGGDTKQELAITNADGKISVFRIYEQVGCVCLYSKGKQFSSLDDLINYYRQTVLPSGKYKLTLMRGLYS